MRIRHRPSEKEDQYHICAVFGDTGGEIELLGDIETDKALYEIK